MLQEGCVVVIKSDPNKCPYVVKGRKIDLILPSKEKIINESLYVIYNIGVNSKKKFLDVEENDLTVIAESEMKYNSRK